LVVGVGSLKSVAPGHFAPFRSIVADDRDQRRVSSSMRKRRENGDLGDMAESNHGVPNGFHW
jgi:hypothetical protein